MALRDTIKEALYLSGMLKWVKSELLGGVSSPNIMPILTNSESARKLVENPEFHKRSKHIDIAYHFIRECIKEKKVKSVFIRTIDQLANGFTKGLNKYKYNSFIECLNLQRPKSSSV